MKTHRVELWCKVLMIVLLFSCTSYAQESALRVEIKSEQRSVKTGESFEVTTQIVNISQKDQHLQIWACSYSDNWVTDNPYVHLNGEPCNKNFIGNVVLKRGEVYENRLSLNITVSAEEILVEEVTFKLGFKLFDKTAKDEVISDVSAVIWSNPMSMKIKENLFQTK